MTATDTQPTQHRHPPPARRGVRGRRADPRDARPEGGDPRQPPLPRRRARGIRRRHPTMPRVARSPSSATSAPSSTATVRCRRPPVPVRRPRRGRRAAQPGASEARVRRAHRACSRSSPRRRSGCSCSALVGVLSVGTGGLLGARPPCSALAIGVVTADALRQETTDEPSAARRPRRRRSAPRPGCCSPASRSPPSCIVRLDLALDHPRRRRRRGAAIARAELPRRDADEPAQAVGGASSSAAMRRGQPLRGGPGLGRPLRHLHRRHLDRRRRARPSCSASRSAGSGRRSRSSAASS